MLGDVTDTLFRVVSTGGMAGQVFLSGTVSQSVGSYSINIRVSSCSYYILMNLLHHNMAQAFRVVGASTTPRSDISTVSMTITITDINDNSPIFLNPRSTPISILEVRKIQWFRLWHFISSYCRQDQLVPYCTHIM